jgi:hypothetical protein
MISVIWDTMPWSWLKEEDDVSDFGGTGHLHVDTKGL